MKRVLIPLVLPLLVLAGCSAPQTQALRQAPPAPESAVVELRDVPFRPGAARDGAPAAMSAMLAFSGRDVAPPQVEAALGAQGGGSALVLPLASTARRQGRLIYPVAPQLDALLAALGQGYPVLVLRNTGLSLFPSWHYEVLVGADRGRGTFVLHSGDTPRLEVPFASFERSWARAGYWGALVLDPRGIPESLDARAVIRELAVMEREGALADAQAGFNRALLNWPEQKTAWLGLASTSQALGEMDKAESVLRELVRRAPQYGAGLNNLADLLIRTGRPLEALPLAERAVSLLDIPQTRGTLQAARAALAPVQSEPLPAAPGDLSPAEARPVATATPAKAAAKKHRKRVRKPAPPASEASRDPAR